MSTSNTTEGAAAIAEEMAQPRRSRRSVWRQFRRHKLALGGLAVLVIFSVGAAFAPVVAWHGPNKVNLDHVQQPPSLSHPLGTDSAGRDVFSRILHAGRVSLSVGAVATLISVAIGTVVGLVSGYAGGWIDNVLQRFTEYVMTFPTLFALLVLVSILGSSVFIIMLIIGILGWTGKARLVRGQVLQGRELDYVAAARALGASDMRILFVHILPAVVPFIVVAATLSLAGAIIAESSSELPRVRGADTDGDVGEYDDLRAVAAHDTERAVAVALARRGHRRHGYCGKLPGRRAPRRAGPAPGDIGKWPREAC